MPGGSCTEQKMFSKSEDNCALLSIYARSPSQYKIADGFSNLPILEFVDWAAPTWQSRITSIGEILKMHAPTRVDIVLSILQILHIFFKIPLNVGLGLVYA
jgi:hypothetical protein